MKIAVISDIHANLAALTAVLAGIRQERVNLIVCAGDIIGYGDEANRCCDQVRAVCDDGNVVMGNHELALRDHGMRSRMTQQAMSGIDRAKVGLSVPNHFWLTDLPLSTTLLDGEIAMAHASLWNPLSMDYVRTFEEAHRELGAAGGASVVIIGHTHLEMAIDRHERYRTDLYRVRPNNPPLLINPGSVGKTANADGRPRYAILEKNDGSWSVRFCRA
jgi:predicted phosphodiesterase